jgi:hypothetical protein
MSSRLRVRLGVGFIGGELLVVVVVRAHPDQVGQGRGVRPERVLGEQRRAGGTRLRIGREGEAVDGARLGDPDAAHAGPAAGRDRLPMRPDDGFDVVQQGPGQASGVPGGRGPDRRRGGAVRNLDDHVVAGTAVAGDDQAGRQGGRRAARRVQRVPGRWVRRAERGQHPAQQQPAAHAGQQDGGVR